MKNSIIVLIALACLFSACTDFLEHVDPNEISNQTFWNSEQEAEMALAGCYDALQDEYLFKPSPNGNGPFNFEFMTDNGFFTVYYDWMQGAEVARGDHNASSYVFLGFWTASYNVISRCNQVIHQVSRMPENAIGETAASRIIAEAKVVRALLYNQLALLYRDVPLILEPQTIPESQQTPKSDRAAIVSAIVADLEGAAQVLPPTIDKGTELGRATRGAALALLARVCLYHGLYEKAAQAAQQVIGSGLYGLHGTYASLFTFEGGKSDEILFSVRYKGTGLSEGGYLSLNYGYPPEWMVPFRNLADAYHCVDGKPIQESPLYDPDDDSTRDPRLMANITTPNSYWEWTQSKYAWWYWNSPSGLFYRKFQREYNEQVWDDSQDYYLIRYADVLLMRAEALALAAGDANEIKALVDAVRTRVGMPGIDDAEGQGKVLTHGELLDIVKHERRVELAFEGLRYFDLFRWRAMESAYAVSNAEGLGSKRDFNPDRHYVWPIPQAELDNNKALVQAPEW